MAQESNEILLRDPANMAIDKHILIEEMARWLHDNDMHPLLLLDVEPQPGQRTGIAGRFVSYNSSTREIELDGSILDDIDPEYRWNYRIPWDVSWDITPEELADYWTRFRIITFNEFLWNVSDVAGTAGGWVNNDSSLAWPRDFLVSQNSPGSAVYNDQQHFKCVSFVFSDLPNQLKTAEDVYGNNQVPIGDINCCGGGNG